MAMEKPLHTGGDPDLEQEIDLAVPMQSAAMAASNLLRAIGSPHRLMILCHLMEREMTVTDLCSSLGLRQSLVSQHLTHLRLNGLVTSERRGHFSYYSLTNEPAREIVSVLYRHFCAPPAPGDGC
jgi:DNA-binding transcriptional ArsR family regulator